MSSLREIADRAGVSVATVSRVMNDVDHQKVSASTRERVLRIAQDLRYRPNPQAVALVTRRPPNTVGLVIPYNSHVFESFYFTEIIRGAVDAANDHAMSITLFVPRRDAPAEEYHDVLMARGMVAGFLLIGTRIGDPAIAQCREAGVPFVLVNSRLADPDVSGVDCDNLTGARDAIRHLIRLGHKRIAFIAGPDSSSNARERLSGYRSALEEAGMAVDDNLIRPGRFEEQSGREAMCAILDRPVRPTAVFAANDIMAIGAMKVLKREGLSVPDDMAIVGFDDIPMCQYLEPALTTVHQPIYQVGRRAAETLLSRIEEPDDAMTAGTRHILRTRLVIRESCGARARDGSEGAP